MAASSSDEGCSFAIKDASGVYGPGHKGVFAQRDLPAWTTIISKEAPLAVHIATSKDSNTSGVVCKLTKLLIEKGILLDDLDQEGLTFGRLLHPVQDKEQAKDILGIEGYDKSYQLALRVNGYAYFCLTPFSCVGFAFALYGKNVSSLNHSCHPNCYSVFDRDGNYYLIAFRDVRAGAELTVSYVTNVSWMEREEREDVLANNSGILSCKCSLCTGDPIVDVCKADRMFLGRRLTEDERDMMDATDGQKRRHPGSVKPRINCVLLLDKVNQRIRADQVLKSRPSLDMGNAREATRPTREERLVRFYGIGEAGCIFGSLVRDGRSGGASEEKYDALVNAVGRLAVYGPDPQFILSAAAACLVISRGDDMEVLRRHWRHFLAVQIQTHLPRDAVATEIASNPLFSSTILPLVSSRKTKEAEASVASSKS